MIGASGTTNIGASRLKKDVSSKSKKKRPKRKKK